MVHEVVSALAAQKWAGLVQSCCPGVMRTEWHVESAQVSITAWVTPHEGELTYQAPQLAEFVAGPDTVDDYISAAETDQFRADAKLVDFVILHLQRLQFARSPAWQQWSITSAGLGLRHSHKEQA
jgi:hypothetical protein